MTINFTKEIINFHFSEILWKWPLFGSSFFAVKRVPEGKEKGGDHILALNRHGVHFIDLITHVSNPHPNFLLLCIEVINNSLI